MYTCLVWFPAHNSPRQPGRMQVCFPVTYDDLRHLRGRLGREVPRAVFAIDPTPIGTDYGLHQLHTLFAAHPGCFYKASSVSIDVTFHSRAQAEETCAMLQMIATHVSVKCRFAAGAGTLFSVRLLPTTEAFCMTDVGDPDGHSTLYGGAATFSKIQSALRVLRLNLDCDIHIDGLFLPRLDWTITGRRCVYNVLGTQRIQPWKPSHDAQQTAWEQLYTGTGCGIPDLSWAFGALKTV